MLKRLVVSLEPAVLLGEGSSALAQRAIALPAADSLQNATAGAPVASSRAAVAARPVLLPFERGDTGLIRKVGTGLDVQSDPMAAQAGVGRADSNRQAISVFPAAPAMLEIERGRTPLVIQRALSGGPSASPRVWTH